MFPVKGSHAVGMLILGSIQIEIMGLAVWLRVNLASWAEGVNKSDHHMDLGSEEQLQLNAITGKDN